MKTIRLTKMQSEDERIQRVSDTQAAVLVRRGDALYVPKSKWKGLRDAEIQERHANELRDRLDKTFKANLSKKPDMKDRKHFKKGRRNEHKHTGSRKESANTAKQQPVQEQVRKAIEGNNGRTVVG